MERNLDFYALLLAYAFVEIRGLDDAAGLSTARAIADAFHHVPEALRLDWTEEREQRIREQLHAKARVHGLSAMVERWEERAHRRLAAGR